MPPSTCPFTSGNITPTDVNCLNPEAEEEQLCQNLDLLSLPEVAIKCLIRLSSCSETFIQIIKNSTKVDQIKHTSAQLALSQRAHLCHINKEPIRFPLHQEPKQNQCCLHQTSSVCSSHQEIRRSLQHGMALRGSDNNPDEVQNDSGYGSGRPPAHYYRPSFSSQIDLEKLEKNDKELSQCGFYYGSIDSQTAKDLLRKAPTGTFLIRDSSNSGYLYTLSVKTERGATSVRILYNKGLFQFDSDERIRNKLPQFDSVLGLVDFHVRVTQDGGNKSWQWEEMSGHRSMKATLTKPLKNSVPRLAHLSRVTINQCLPNTFLSQVVDKLPVAPEQLKEFIKEYPYRI